MFITVMSFAVAAAALGAAALVAPVAFERMVHRGQTLVLGSKAPRQRASAFETRLGGVFAVVFAGAILVLLITVGEDLWR